MKKNKNGLFLVLGLSSLILAGCGGSTSNGQSSFGSGEESSGPCTDCSSFPTYEEASFRIHYQRKDRKFSDWALWLWDKAGADGAQYAFNGIDSFGAVASYKMSDISATLKADGLGFIVKNSGDGWTSKDVEGDRFVDFSLFTPDEKNGYDVYLASGDANIYSSASLTKADAFSSCRFSTLDNIHCDTTNEVSSYVLKINNEEKASETFKTPTNSFNITLPDGGQADFASSYEVTVVFSKSGKTLSSSVNKNTLYNTLPFKNKYTYDGDDLGAVISGSKTSFKVWSPVSTSISLRVYGNGTPVSVDANKGNDTYTEYPMTMGDKGVYATEVEGNLGGKYYTYFVKNSTYPAGREVVDPYARSAGVNGLRGMVVDEAESNPDGWDSFDKALTIDRKALTVYECHIADLTASTSWGGTSENAKTYAGFHETGTTYTSDGKTVKTGFDHVKELGVNAVQILPMFDSANDEVQRTFNWGYNPLNYNVVDGSYSSDPYDGYVRIKELKSLVKDYHDAGINIIMDVVYNHTASVTGMNFDVLMPGYYYRYDSKGTLTNGSGCGNETASEMPMMSKFMIDSTAYWTKEFKLGGFRFDLMGLHDVKTMNALVANLKTINPSICVYGEPWTGGASGISSDVTPATQANGNSYDGYGQFNDGFRDALIKGGLNAATAKGWIAKTAGGLTTAEQDSLFKGINGYTYSNGTSIKDPDKTVNYVTCHDNYTLYDRFYFGNNVTDVDTVKKMAVLSNAVVFTSNGTSFMQGGEEFFRTKKGNSNSYSADYNINSFRYNRKLENPEAFADYQKLIAFKQTVSSLHQDAEAIEKNPIVVDFKDNNEIIYNLPDTNSGRTYRVIHANGSGTPANVDLGGYSLYLDTLDSDKSLTSATTVAPYETIIAYK